MFGLFGKKKKNEGGRLSDVLTASERNTLIAYLSSMTIIGATEDIKDACREMIPVVERDEVLIPGAVQGLINVCKVQTGVAGQEKEAKTIIAKLNKLL